MIVRTQLPTSGPVEIIVSSQWTNLNPLLAMDLRLTRLSAASVKGLKQFRRTNVWIGLYVKFECGLGLQGP